MNKQVNFEDDLVILRNKKGEVMYKGMYDYLDEEAKDVMKWNATRGLYELPKGWTLEVL